MLRQLMEEVLDFLTLIVEDTNQQKVNVTFYGGEPLEAGFEILCFAIKVLHEKYDFMVKYGQEGL